jgi:K+-transporting ATPase ATPase A chain
MNAEFIGLLGIYLAVLFAIAPFLGRYIRVAVEGQGGFLTAWGRPLERGFYRLAGVDPEREMGWKQYAVSVLAFSALGRVRGAAPAGLPAAEPARPAQRGPDSAFNTASASSPIPTGRATAASRP